MTRRPPSPRAIDDVLPPEWRPVPLVTLGVTGHRPARLGEAPVATITAAIDAVLRATEAAARAVQPATAFRTVNALAEGADCLAAEAALARGWTLDAVLPFARDEYADDFADAPARTRYTAQLGAAAAVLELPGERAAEARDAAYERAGRVLLGQSDLLLAVWDGAPAQGRGGTAQIVAEAVLQDIPVIQIHPGGVHDPIILWDGLVEHELGQQTVDTVARGPLAALPHVMTALLAEPAAPGDLEMVRLFARPPRRGVHLALAYPLLLGVMGVRRPTLADARYPDAEAAVAPVLASCAATQGHSPAFGAALRGVLAPRFARADVEATQVARLFRSSYVANYALAALAVVLSLTGLVIAATFKPVLAVLEFATLTTILGLTRTGHRARWHRRWLDNRELAERLRCLALGAQLGELNLRAGRGDRSGWVDWYVRATARELRLPSVAVDDTYLGCVRASLTALLDDQIGYLGSDARRMHRFDHRLHRLGTLLFAVTAAICAGVFLLEALQGLHLIDLHAVEHRLTLAATVASATLPAVGAAIYGIRMQGDFSGIAERNEALVHQLATLRHVVDQDELGFDALRRRVARANALLNQDLTRWRQTYHARPLSLPG